MTGGSIAGCPGFRSPLRPANRPAPKPYPGHAEYERQAKAAQAAQRASEYGLERESLIKALEIVGKSVAERGPRGVRFLGAHPVVARDEVTFAWRVPVRGYFAVAFEGCELFRYNARKLADRLCDEMRASFELAGSGPVEGAGELL